MQAVKIATLLLLLGMPLLVGQMCAGLEPFPDGNDPVPDNGQDPPPPPPPPPPPTAKTITGPGFSLVIPAGFTQYQEQALTTAAAFEDRYGDGQRIIALSTGTPLPGGPFDFSSNCIRIKGPQTTDSGDFVLTAAKITSRDSAEVHAAYALLANGDMLCVEVAAGDTLSSADLEFGAALFRTIILEDTNGRALEQKLWSNHPKLLVCTANGLMVLDDLGAWAIADQFDSDSANEMKVWPRGCAIHVQMASQDYELMQVGRWVAASCKSLSVATETVIADYDPASKQMIFANGHTVYVGQAKLPDVWELGDEVLLVRDQSIFWVIWCDTMKAVRISSSI